jgi:hypothetical protein
VPRVLRREGYKGLLHRGLYTIFLTQLVKTKRQANFKDFKRFGAFNGLVDQKNVVFNSFLCKLDFFGTRGPLNWPTCDKKPQF